MIEIEKTTTTFSLPGFHTTHNLGVVRGITVRTRSLPVNIWAALITLVGGKVEPYVSLCERTRKESFDLMVQHAEELGANAIIGIRYDATEVMAGVTEVLAYGAAVIVEKIHKEA